MRLFLGDCFDVLKTISDDSVDSLVTDPPAGISFMGKSWDSDKGGRKEWVAWMESVMRECMRVMKPGAHGLVWALPRTSHWTATALEDAGFEVRDVITHLFGQGFPKSLDISKAIDKAAGAEREIISTRKLTGKARVLKGGNFDGDYKGKELNAEYSETAPATNEAKQWSGWGTALKPANEQWILVRKPISEKNIAANVLKWGTGGLNIDGCRIEAKDQAVLDAAVKKMTGNLVVKSNSTNFLHGLAQIKPNSAQGRFPSNLVFSHSPYCTDEQCDIECAIEGLNKQAAQEASRYFYCAKISPSERNAGLDRAELVWNQGVWEIVALISSAENVNRLVRDISESLMRHLESKSWSTDLYGHSISEQYPTGFKSIIETVLKLIIELRTSSSSAPLSTRENILDALKMIEVSGLSLADAVEFSKTLTLNTISEETASLLSVSNALLKELSEIRRFAVSGNFHSTVKPQKLMRYLCRLVTPPGGVILDPFMGSGSTGLAAKSEGFKFVGIERETEYFEIAKKRINDIQTVQTASGVPPEQGQN